MNAPGPRGRFLVGSLLEYRRDPLGALTGWARQYGRVARFRLGPVTAHLASHPDDVREVLGDNHGRFVKTGMITDRMRGILGDGLLNSTGAKWQRQRRLMQPGFHRERLAGFVRTMAAAAGEAVARWRPAAELRATVDVGREMAHLTLDIVARTLFSADVGADAAVLARAVTVALEHTVAAMHALAPLPAWVPTPGNRRFAAAIADLDRVVYRLIGERRRKGGRDDLLQLLVEARDEESGEGMTDEQVRDEVLNLFLAGHETTANALSWTFYLLARHPEAAARVAEEAAALAPAATAEDVARLRYTSLSVQESMRLYPPIWATGRVAVGAQRLGGFAVPDGSLVLLSPWVMHRDPSLWPEPERFEPERFLPERAEARPRYAWFPFGGGARLCLGNHFALMEMAVVLATVLARYRLTLPPSTVVQPDPQLSLRPKYGMPMTVEPR